MLKVIRCWIEAMRLRTIPVSVAGVLTGCAFANMDNSFEAGPATVCLVFAILAQIASNFANEYYDYQSGYDRRGRVGPRRGVTEGDISPRAMKMASYLTLGLASLVGLTLIYWSGWWIILVGIAIVLGALAYSTGPYPLAKHGLGEVAVLFFFGIIPVNLTFWLQTHFFDWSVFLGSLSLGLMGANVLLVNNYRDYRDDRGVGKRTLAVRFGRNAAATLYLINGWTAGLIMMPAWAALGQMTLGVPMVYILLHTALWGALLSRRGINLNPILGFTSLLMLAYAVAFLVLS